MSGKRYLPLTAVFSYTSHIRFLCCISITFTTNCSVAEKIPNPVAQWREEIFGDAENAVANINLAEKNALEAIKTEGATQIENVKATAQGIEAERQQIYLNNTLKASVI